MNPFENAQLEDRVNRIVEAVSAGRRVEDAIVELKADWPNPRRAARQLAAQANAARGEAILWILGLKETEGVRTLTPEEPSAWYAQLASAFEKPAPRLLNDREIATMSGTVRALLFSTDEAPYLVSMENEGGQKRTEVLWREGTGTRPARRIELLSMLVPQARLPDVEVLACTLFAYDRVEPPANLMLQLDLYIVPQDNGSLVFPFHRISGELRRSGLQSSFSRVELAWPAAAIKVPHLVEGDFEVTLTGASKVLLTAEGVLPIARLREADHVLADFRLLPAGQARPVVVAVPLSFAPTPEYVYRYVLEGKPWE
jgi:hypothetical protein